MLLGFLSSLKTPKVQGGVGSIEGAFDFLSQIAMKFILFMHIGYMCIDGEMIMLYYINNQKIQLKEGCF